MTGVLVDAVATFGICGAEPLVDVFAFLTRGLEATGRFSLFACFFAVHFFFDGSVAGATEGTGMPVADDSTAELAISEPDMQIVVVWTYLSSECTIE